MKAAVLAHLRERLFDVTDLCAADGAQYPAVGYALAHRIKAGDFDRGIVICGTGTGVAMSACKVRGIFAGTVADLDSARRLAANNNAQVLAMGSEVVSIDMAKVIAQIYLETEFLPKRNADMMRHLEAIQT